MFGKKKARENYKKLPTKDKLRRNYILLFISLLVIGLGYLFSYTGSGLLALFIYLIGAIYFITSMLGVLKNTFFLMKEKKATN